MRSGSAPVLCADPEASFRAWMLGVMPAGSQERRFDLVTSDSSTMYGALGDIWEAVCAALNPQPGAPSLTVVLLPSVPALQQAAGMRCFRSG